MFKKYISIFIIFVFEQDSIYCKFNLFFINIKNKQNDSKLSQARTARINNYAKKSVSFSTQLSTNH